MTTMFAASNQAMAITAGDVRYKMSSDEQFAYVLGVIEGLAYARYVKDSPDETGMQCIYNWYQKDSAVRWTDTLFPFFEKYSDKPVGVLLYVLTKKVCGE